MTKGSADAPAFEPAPDQDLPDFILLTIAAPAMHKFGVRLHDHGGQVRVAQNSRGLVIKHVRNAHVIISNRKSGV